MSDAAIPTASTYVAAAVEASDDVVLSLALLNIFAVPAATRSVNSLHLQMSTGITSDFVSAPNRHDIQ
jgi:hypothetical protein